MSQMNNVVRTVLVAMLAGFLGPAVWSQDFSASGSACSGSWEPPWKEVTAGGGLGGKESAARFGAQTTDVAGLLGGGHGVAGSVGRDGKDGVYDWVMFGVFSFLILFTFWGAVELVKRLRRGGHRHSQHYASSRRSRSSY